MSASQEKKRRQGVRGAEMDKLAAEQAAAQKKKSIARVRNTIIAVVVVLAIAAIVVINSNLFYTGMSAVTINGTDFTAAEVSYLYNTTYLNYVAEQSELASSYGMDAATYLSMMGLDPQVSLKEQTYPIDTSKTWHDYFLEETMNRLKEVAMYSNAAKEAGYTLDEEDQKVIENDLTTLTSYAEVNSYANLKQYLAARYGKGVTEDTVREMIGIGRLASKYSEDMKASFTYEDAELDEWYAQNKDSYALLSYYEFFIDGSVSADIEEPTDEQKAEAMAAAKEKAEAFAAKVSDETSFAEQALVYATENLAGGSASADVSLKKALGSNLSATYSKWMLDAERKLNDVTVAEASSGYYVVMFVDRSDNDYALQQVRHILVKAAANSDGEFTDAAKATAKETAEKYLAEWKAGAATEESFAEMANRYSEDGGSNTTGGLYDKVMKEAYVPEFEAFAFEEGRKPGDTGIVYGETQGSSPYAGYHIMYYVGEGQLYSRYIAETQMRSNDYSAWREAQIASAKTETAFSFRFIG